MKNIVLFQSDLLKWYHKNARVLPWRSNPTPYRVWISEMMLQQTRVDTVIPYFTRFMNELPDIPALAGVEEDKLLKLWQGLGYYNRALNLKKTAKILVEKYQGQLPSDVKTLMELPGIGPYSAGAIASIAFEKAVPAVDGNVLRIMARILASREDMNQVKIKKQMQEFMLEVVPLNDPGAFNQAMMDLGATICLPNGEPKCEKCPVRKHCRAFELKLTSQIPIKVSKKRRGIEEKTVFVLSSGEKFALQKRKAGGLLPNLWEFPNTSGYLTEEQSRSVLEDWGILVEEMLELKPSKHIFSHIEWHMKGFFVTAANTDKSSSNFVWVTKEEIQHQYSIPTAFKDFIKYILK
ncbi:A/G-specific adenine glycosylase [Aminipila luticellarii]|uniref:Adenine DNA glycosylase n=1 Tax=Aminipila luticellarii TaxID=2507160 RepID=A0A410PZ24_9FIRM|nr:A/G-specific adenine glycosylase [Aminipila luticellarii]